MPQAGSDDQVLALVQVWSQQIPEKVDERWWRNQLGRARDEEAALRRSRSLLTDGATPGRPIDQWDPHDLEVHPAGPAADGRARDTTAVLPGYVRRAHDEVLDEAVRAVGHGRSRMLVLVGTSSTGKTRACWEAIQPLAQQDWRLWHPLAPTRVEGALEDLGRVQPYTVIWLNEAQHYLGDTGTKERVAAALHTLLTDPARMPVLILGTLWPEHKLTFTGLPAPGEKDLYSRVRELLAGRTLAVPDRFTPEELRAASLLAKDGDRLLADTLTRAHTDGRVTQDLAGAPELLRRYEDSTPAARALLEAAMDARRLGIGLHLPQAFLTEAASDYFSDHDYDHLTGNWAAAAYRELALPVHGKHAPLFPIATRPERSVPGSPDPSASLRQSASPVLRLADYLEQHGRTSRQALCPPASFWHAAYTHLIDPADQFRLARAARARWRFRWEHHLLGRAARSGHIPALIHLAEIQRDAGERERAESLYLRAADAGDDFAMVNLVGMWREAGNRERAEALALQGAGHGYALFCIAGDRERAGDWAGAEAFYLRAADAGDAHALFYLAGIREEAGDQAGAEVLYLRAADAGDAHALVRHAEVLEKAGDQVGAEALYQRAADAGQFHALVRLVGMREEAGDPSGAEALALRNATAGHTDPLVRLVEMRATAGDPGGAEALALRNATAGHTDPLVRLVEMRATAGDP
ncbi:hypothetical protein, partial [Streptomyces sp. NPDC086182]|uniref:tetratricopeptide repeat protein n=1 Tax=Streptomyces sp. NPDC086182 TaxID=3155058 RepID=UPI003415E132